MSDWITIDSLPHEALAHLWRDRLTQEDIPCQLRGLGLTSTQGIRGNVSWGNPLGGIEVLVMREDAAKARSILGLEHSRRIRSAARWYQARWIQWMVALYFGVGLGGVMGGITNNAYVGAASGLALAGGLLWWSRTPRDAS